MAHNKQLCCARPFFQPPGAFRYIFTTAAAQGGQCTQKESTTVVVVGPVWLVGARHVTGCTCLDSTDY